MSSIAATLARMATENETKLEESAAQRRANALHRLNLSAEVDQEFDELVELAALICGKPMGAMTLLDDTRLFTKATVGMPAAVLPVDESVCQYTVQQDHLLMVEDLTADSRFDHRDYVENGSIRFYAGAPLITQDGTHVGALCVMDRQPSTLSPDQVRALEVLGRQMSSLLQLRERDAQLTRAMEERARGNEMLHTILNNIPFEIYLKDADGRFVFYNRKLAKRFDVSEQDWIGLSSYDLWPHEAAEAIFREEQFVMRSGQQHENYVELPETADRISYWHTVQTPIVNEQGVRLLAGVAVDVTEQMQREAALQRTQDQLEEANRKLNSMALTDALTGLWNRRAFDARLETSVIGAQRSREPMSLLLLDVDDFKSINDRFGHPYGDVVLRNTAAVLQRVMRAEDIACRFGGEEFAVLLPGSNAKGAELLAQRILDGLRAFPWEKCKVTASIGVAVCSQNCSSDDLVDAADEALYVAKREGKNRVVFHENCGK